MEKPEGVMFYRDSSTGRTTVDYEDLMTYLKFLKWQMTEDPDLALNLWSAASVEPGLSDDEMMARVDTILGSYEVSINIVVEAVTMLRDSVSV